MKTAIIDSLYWILEKLEGQRIQKVDIGYTMKFGLQRVIPRNGKWYNVSMSVSAWVMIPKKGKELTISECAVYKDGTAVNKKIDMGYIFGDVTR